MDARSETRFFLIVGIGSSHGDDRLGWSVIERLEAANPQWALLSKDLLRLRKAASPHELLDWMHCDCEVHIVDSVVGQNQIIDRYLIECAKDGALDCIQLPFSNSSENQVILSPVLENLKRKIPLANCFETDKFKSSHQLDLISTLELASVMGLMPRHSFLWTLAMEAATGYSELSVQSEEAIAIAISHLLQHICNISMRRYLNGLPEVAS